MDISTIRNVCRACLSETGESKSVFVFDELYDEHSGYTIHLSEMIMSCASVQITFGDGLPEQICDACAEQSVNMYLFKLKCEKSDKILRERLERSPLQEIYNVREEIYSETTEINDNNGADLNGIIKTEISIDEPHEDDPNDDKTKATFGFNDTESNGDSENRVLGGNELCKKEFKCEFCNKTLCNQSMLNRHIKSHSAIKELKCETCKRVSRKHLLPHKVCYRQKLDDSELEFGDFSVSDALKHDTIIKKAETELYSCPACSVPFKENEDIVSHAKKMNDSKLEFGDFTVNNAFEDDTIINKTETELYPCPECSVPFEKKEEMEMHVKQHEKVSSYISCHVCTKKFKKQDYLNRHLRTHGKTYICSTCNEGFFRAKQLNNHMMIHSGVKRHICNTCAKGFNCSSHLKNHMRVHSGEKPFLCSICHKGFSQESALRVHMKRHNSNKPFLCSICGHNFVSKCSLSVHLRRHTGARPYVCPICSHSFSTSGTLAVHKRIHSGEKPYECDVCKMKFRRSSILKCHKRKHTGEKPYVCKYCAKAFARSNELTSHIRIHTGEKPYICDVCGRAFRCCNSMKRHKKTHLKSASIAGSGGHGCIAGGDFIK